MRTGLIAGRALAVAAALALAAAATAPAATITLQPAAGDARSFGTSQGGWTSSVAYGTTCVVPGVTCPLGTPSFQASGGSGGAGDGFLRAAVTTFVSVAADVTVTWASPSFTAPAGTDEATLGFSVRPQISSLLGLGGTVSVSVDAVLSDLDVPASSTALAAVPLTVASGSFAPQQLTVPPGALVAGHRYAIELRTVVNAPAALGQSGSVDLDDVTLQMTDLLPPTGLTASVPSTGAPRVEGQVDPQGQATSVTVEYGPTAGYGSATAPASVSGAGGQPFAIPLAGLNAGATYHFRVVAANADGRTATSDATFVAPAFPSDPAPDPSDDPVAPGSPSGSAASSGIVSAGSALTDPARFGALLAGCFGASDLVVSDARQRGGSVRVSGLTRFAAGTPIAIRDERGRTVGHATADAHGRFSAVVAPPSVKRRPHTLYSAVAGASRSGRLRLQRSNAIRSVQVRNDVATIRGVADPRSLGRRPRIAASGARGAAACVRAAALRRVGKVRLDRRTGAYVLRVRVPSGRGMLAVRTRVAGRRISTSAYALR